MTADLPLRSVVDAVVAELRPQQNPYFVALVDGSLSRADFLETQYQFHAAVTFFSRPMATLAAKIVDPALRAAIVRNVWEEHGEGDPAKMHGATFVSFLARLAGTDEATVHAELARRAPWPEVHLFDAVLVGAVSEDVLVGTATLGIIEHMFSSISAWIGRGVVARGFLREEQLVHYDLHERLDVRHAADFFAVLEPAWARGERASIEQGLRLGALAFDDLYRHLHRARARRWLR